jgi:magnesium-transporting ATPase (P-type)
VQVVADGVVTESFGLVLDEASLTGESDPIKKNEEDPWCRSGTQVGAAAPDAVGQQQQQEQRQLGWGERSSRDCCWSFNSCPGMHNSRVDMDTPQQARSLIAAATRQLNDTGG